MKALKRVTIILFVTAVVLWGTALCALADSAEPSGAPAETAAQSEKPSAQLQADGTPTPEINPVEGSLWKAALQGRVNAKNFNEFADGLSEEQLRQRPLLYWRRWANKPLPVVAASLFLFAVAVVLSEAFNARLAAARVCCRQQFWRCLGRGILVTLVSLMFVRPLMLSVVGIPLAILIVGAVECLMLAGFAVSATLLGESILQRIGVADRLASRPFLHRLMNALVGTVLLSLVLAIPGIGPLPRIGIRLLVLVCMMGSGGLIKSRNSAA